jgi:glycosyltransferase involved in cell wall biosynthesis
LLLVITTTERKLLQATGIARNPVLIPHFVENIPAPRSVSAPAALPSMKTVIIAGYILNSKGHHLLLEAMKLLPDVRVVFLGGHGVGSSAYEHYSRVMSLARDKGVKDRLEVTGYLPDEEFQRRLSMADLAVCPFGEQKSASGSLSALIAAGCPILASDIPLIAEYNAMVPGAIAIFSPYTPEALAASIRRLLTMPRAKLTDGIAKLAKLLSIETIYDRHVKAYRQVLRARPIGAQSSCPVVSQ